MSIFFTADQHFYHQNIIKYCNRPFKTVAEMNEVIINNHNSMIKKDDVVFHLGDFVPFARDVHWNKVEKILKRLNGQHHLILGNHDYMNPFKYLEAGFLSVHTSIEDEFILVHDPAISAIDRSKMFLCGHIHGLFKIQKNVLNVGVDVWDFKPVSFDNAYEEFAKIGKINE